MKTSKRKRSSKAASVTEAPSVDVLAAAESSPAADVSNQSAAPLAEVAAEQSCDASNTTAEQGADVVGEAAVADIAAESVSEPAAEVVLEPVADASSAAAEQAAQVAAEPAVVGDPIVVLAANCSVKDAAALKSSLCAFSNHGEAVTVDVSAVERVDTATMQLLCAFVRDRSGRNQSVTWRGESAALHDAVRLLGVGELIGIQSRGVAA